MDQGLSVGWGAVATGKAWGSRIGHVLHRDNDLQIELLGHSRIDDLALPLGTDEEPSYPLKRPLRCGKPNPLKPNRISRGWRCRGDRP